MFRARSTVFAFFLAIAFHFLDEIRLAMEHGGVRARVVSSYLVLWASKYLAPG